MKGRTWLMVALLTGAFSLGAARTARACPMCKAAITSDDRRPQAFMYSILFMLAMPATIFTGFSIGFYRLSRRRTADDSSVPDDADTRSPV